MKRFLFVLGTLSLLLVSGCDKANNDPNGRLVISITDGPFPINFVESATVTITKIEIRKAGDGVPDGNPFLTVWEGTESFDLLQLRNGLVETLTDIEVPVGKYDLVRLYVDKAGLKIKDGGNFDVKVPSGSQTGIKIFIKPDLIVEGGLTAELLLDFDLSSSFVMRGNPDSPAGINGFIFKPVIRAANNTESGRIEGSVVDSEGAAIAEVMIEVMQHTRFFSSFVHLFGFSVIQRNRLLTEDLLASPGTILDDESMRIGTGHNQDCLNGCIRQQLVVVAHHPLDAKFVCHCLCHFKTDIANRHQLRFGK